MRFLTLGLLATLLVAAAPVRADWPAATRVTTHGYQVTRGSLFPDAANGGVVSLVGSHHTVYGMRYMNRIAPDGTRPSPWADSGHDTYVDDAAPLARFAVEVV